MSTSPSLCEDPQRLAHRRAADAGLVGQVRLGQAGAGSLLAHDDPLGEPVRDRPREQLVLGRMGRFVVEGEGGGLIEHASRDVLCVVYRTLTLASPFEGVTVKARSPLVLFVLVRARRRRRCGGRTRRPHVAPHRGRDAEARRLDHDRAHRGLAVVRQDERLPERVDLARRADHGAALHRHRRRQEREAVARDELHAVGGRQDVHVQAPSRASSSRTASR